MAKVMVGLSGGVDSAVAAYLLKAQGYEVIGAFMRNWDSLANNDILGNKSKGDICPQEQDFLDAQAVADKLGIPLLRVDFVKEYWDYVFTYFLQEYQKGRTPNPDVLCNKYIKFDAFLKFAMQHNVDYVATGHYAKITHCNGLNILAKASDLNKDQSYFLSLLTSAQLEKVLFPLADISKPEVRKIAASLQLETVATKKDSTGICFIGERDFRKFLQNYIPAAPGDIVDLKTDQVIGHHNGVMYYTLGQRKGLQIGGLKNHEAGSWFVVKKDVEKRRLYVVQGNDDILYNQEVVVTDVNWINPPKPQDFTSMSAKFRYRQKDTPVLVRFVDETTLLVHCQEKVKAITPGQICVLYQDNVCLGGGTIDSVK